MPSFLITAGLFLVIIGASVNIYRRIFHNIRDKDMGRAIQLIGVFAVAIGIFFSGS